MTDADALLAAVRANPDDDLPRLVYADWMEENGHPAFAAFIRESIERAGDPPHGWPPHWEALRAAYPKALVAGHWWPSLFPRGICQEDVTVPGEEFVKSSAHWWPIISPSEVTVNDPDEWWQELPHVPLLSELVAFGMTPCRMFNSNRAKFEDRPMRPGTLRAMIRSPLLGNVRRFSVGSIRATWAVLFELKNSELVTRLDELHIEVIDARTSGIRHLPLHAVRAANQPSIRRQIDSYLNKYSDRLSTAE